MQAIIRFLQENPVRLPATIGLDGKPEVRPFHFMPEDNGKSWHCTGNRKDAYAGLQQQPYIELPTASEKPDWPRLSGKAVFENNTKIENNIMEQNDMIVRTRFGMADNPVFAVFYPAEAVAGISGFTGSAARKYHLAEMPFSPEKARTGPSRLFRAEHFRQPLPFEET